jgi:hypothetical protein
MKKPVHPALRPDSPGAGRIRVLAPPPADFFGDLKVKFVPRCLFFGQQNPFLPAMDD